MPDYTPRLNLPLPLGTENVTRQAHIDLVNAIDANAQPLIPAQATAPENPKDGMLWVDTSGTPYQLKQYEAASWNLVGTDTTELQQTVTAHLAENATDAHNDTNISITDPNAHFTATDLQGVLDELFTFANDGKTSVVNAIGSTEASTAETFAQVAGHITTDKETLATNLTNKGQASLSSETLAALVAKVANISTGKKYASGTGTTSADYLSFTMSYDGSTYATNNVAYVTVSGLTFLPKTIVIAGAQGTSNRFQVVYSNTSQFNFDTLLSPPATIILNKQTTLWYAYLTGNAVVTSTGFTLPLSASSMTGLAFNWIAFE